MSSNSKKIITANWPKNLSYDKSVPEIDAYFSNVNGAQKKETSFFYKKTGFDIFILAMGIGKQIGERTKLKKPSQTLPTPYLQEEHVWGMIAVAMAEKDSDLNTLDKGNEMVKICEEYANTGMKTLIVMDGTPEGMEEKFDDLLRRKDIL